MSCDMNNWNNNEIRKNPFFCPDKKSVKLWEQYLLSVRKAGSSCGAIIELRASGIPLGLGAPIYSKLDTDIAAALMSINAVKGVNIGTGMSSAFLSGEENSDEMRVKSGKINFKSNNAGGILGGISTGQNIIKGTKDYQNEEWSEEKKKIENTKKKINDAKNKVLN